VFCGLGASVGRSGGLAVCELIQGGRESRRRELVEEAELEWETLLFWAVLVCEDAPSWIWGWVFALSDLLMDECSVRPISSLGRGFQPGLGEGKG
jgi:hypothetical protein